MSAKPSVEVNAEFHSCVTMFEREVDYIFHALRRHGLGEADAEDVVQEVFLVMWRRWAEYDRSRPLRAWLSGIAFRVAYHHRGRAVREVPGGLIDAVDQQPTPEDLASGNSVRALVLRVLAELPERERTLVRLHDIEDVPMRDIAEVLGIPLQTAHSRLRNGRRNFARGMRRLATVTETKAATLAALGPSVLGGADTPPAPDERRRRAVSRVRGLAPFAPDLVGVGTPSGRGVKAGLLRRTATALLGRAPTLVEGLVLCAAVGLWAVIVAPGVRTAGAGVARADVHVARAPDRPQPRSGSRGAAPRFLASLPAGGIAPGERSAVAAAAQGRPARVEGLIGYWRFEDGPGSSVVRDASGNRNDCLLRGLSGAARWTDGPIGGALELTGDNWLECPQVEAAGKLSRELTIALWVKRTGVEANTRALVSRQLAVGTTDHFQLGFRGERVWLRNLAPKSTTADPSGLERGRWHHLAGSFSADGTARVYVDGTEVASRQLPGRPTLGGGRNPIVIGAAFNGTARHKPTERLRGILDEVMIYDRALSPAEVRGLVDRGFKPDDAPASAPQLEPPVRTVARPGLVYLWQEAEDGTLTAPFAVRDDARASNGRYLAVADGMNAKKTAAAGGQSSLRFDLPDPGNFRIWGRVIAPSTGDDSFWVRLDGGAWLKWNDIAQGNTWHWDQINDDAAVGPSTFALSAGPHTLTIAYREDGARLDRLLITNDLGFTPAGAEP
jgi:RNA polymerase sigma factor (sigma-70 family)